MSKEIEDALHMLLHCSLKDTEYETQFEQYKIVRNYITNLQKEKDTLYNALIITRTKYNNDKARYRRKAKRYRSILSELEKWLKEQGNNGIDEWGNHYTVCLYKLNKLKEKYK